MTTNPDGARLVRSLRQARPVLLACEAIGWLHMTGKANQAFLLHHGGIGVNYDPNDWHQALSPDWSTRIGWVRSGAGNLTWPHALVEFLTKYDEGSSQASTVGLLQAAHAMASGIEKNLPKSISDYLGQDATHMWLVSPFGHPVRNLVADPPPLHGSRGREMLLDRVGRLLDELGRLGSTPPGDAEPWWTWRENAIGENGWLRELFLCTLAETRLPNNDVTLWDQSYVAAALFKAAVAGAALVGATNWQDLKRRTQWRILIVGFGSSHYEARAVKIGDWAGARRDINAFFIEVQRFIEVDLAVGALVYRDDETLAFTFPGRRQDATQSDSKGSLDDTHAEALHAEIEKCVDELARSHDFETPPICHLSSKSTRSFVGMTAGLRQVREELVIPLHRVWQMGSGSEQKGHVCPVCGVRFNGNTRSPLSDNARKQSVCSVCARRRKGRLDDWLLSGNDTIWISEVADGNDRVALLSFSFDLEPWLGGSHVDTLRAQSIAEWRRFNPVLGNQDNPVKPDDPFQTLTASVESKVARFNRNDPLLSSLQEGYRHETNWPEFFSKIVEDRAEAPAWNALDDSQRARWIVHQLFRKLPSPGRVYRFWRTAEEFFDQLLICFRELSAAHPNRWRTRRLVVTPDSASIAKKWLDRETYSSVWRGKPIDLLYRDHDGSFVTISNLARCFDAEEEGNELKGKELLLIGDNGPAQTLAIQDVETPGGLGAYSPVVPLDRSPERFRILVPLDCATLCVESAIKKWRSEFGAVWDRMPLRVGIVAFPRMMPFQAVVESARNLEAALHERKGETWRVSESHTRNGVTALGLERHRSGSEIVLVPTSLPDGRDDVFYAYFRVEDRTLRNPRDFQHPAGQVYRHALDLRRGDGVLVEPSDVAWVFMDTAARRFEPAQVRPLSDFQRMQDTWTLLTRRVPSLSALRDAWSELDQRESAWRDSEGRWLDGGQAAWTDLARAVLGRRLGISGAALETLVEAAAGGTLRWSLEWHLSLLKEKVEVNHGE